MTSRTILILAAAVLAIALVGIDQYAEGQCSSTRGTGAFGGTYQKTSCNDFLPWP